MSNGESGGFLERLRNSPRTVSTIIVILIVVGAIFAFSDRGTRSSVPKTPSATGTPAPESSPTPISEATPTPTAKGETEAMKAVTPTPAPLTEAQETEAAYIEAAARGEGVTHLARRAMLRYVEANKPDFELTAEHKVWIEDSLKDQLGRKVLTPGENLTVDKGMIRDAVEKSKALTDAQRKHLQRFSRLVAAYR